jgi:hypothetical protein
MNTLNAMLAATAGFAMFSNIASADPSQGTVILKPGSMVGLNPQPEPPSTVAKPSGMVGLNPQPEPPSRKKMVLKPSGLVGLNPQPEPPSVLLKGTQMPPK